MKIFLSYASEQSELAKEVALALRAENHTVFFDRSHLAPSEAYNAEICEAIEESQLFIFLISPQAVTKGRYALTELEFAEHKWPHPWGRVLSVMVMATPKATHTGKVQICNTTLQQIGVHGCSVWQGRSGCTRQSIPQNTMFRSRHSSGGGSGRGAWRPNARKQ